MRLEEGSMVHRRPAWVLPFLCAAILALAGRSAGTVLRADAQGPFVFSYFLDNGQDGLHLAYSRDGLDWTALGGGKSFLAPAVGGKLMRDPCIILGPDKVFHAVWTTGWWEQGIGLAHSKDLITWSEQELLPVMAYERSAVNAWAPEILYDAETQQYLIFWATTIPGRFPDTDHTADIRTSDGTELNHRIYRTTTRDFRSFSRAELFYDPGFDVIDATILKDGRRFIMFLKDETKRPEPVKRIRMATADHALGPYSPASSPLPGENWVEGPTAFRVGDGIDVLFDAYTRHRFEGLRSSDLKTWVSITGQLHLPAGARHGSVVPVPGKVLARLLAVR